MPVTSYAVERSLVVGAEPERVHALVDDLHSWQQWSPWEDLDPALERTYSGPERGPGARYSWTGNRKAGAGSMTITRSTPESIEIALTFTRPFRSVSDLELVFTPYEEGTEVTWRMHGQQTGVAAIFGKVVSMERLVAPDFEKGLGNLKRLAEAG